MNTTDKTRLEARVTQHQKELFNRAAAVSGMSLSDFMKNALMEKANRTLRDHDILELCRADQEQLASHLLNPPKTSSGLQELAEWRKQQERDV